ncbi:ABC1 kinase family protein [Desulfogranum japonicum]|uniref:ABC1 kinase family protein n=1 Tax=Desulfogranum japonicum TaxID=231447 RepID=UPI0004215973|nr:AarF/ABC1/UbiB kinase family protein [Desulfogranum japonicum]
MFSIRKLGAIGRTYRHLNRYHRILRVLFKYGFEDLVDRLHIDQYLESGLQMINRKPREQITRFSRPERLRLVFEELGPTFIKLGQLLSTRPDLIPASYVHELTKLQDDIPPFASEAVKEIFQEELGKNPEEFFLSFESEPLAAASIGQVHFARLDSGEEVVVKVQRPKIDQVIAVDLEILAHLASLMEQYLEEFQGHSPSDIVEEFARGLSREIDFNTELANIQRFSRQFEGNNTILVPKVYPHLSTERILVMEYIAGVKCSHLQKLKDMDCDLSLLARRGANLVMEQIFVHGFFHADPHPGNIFILPGNVISFIDFGQMGRLSLRDREVFANLVLSLVSGDERKILNGILAITIQQGEVDRELLSRDLAGLIDLYLYRPLGEIKAAKLLQDMLDLISRHKLSFRPSMYLMMKALSTVEGVGLMLDPDLQLILLAKPFMRKIQLGRMDPRRITEDILDTSESYVQLLREMPDEVLSILKLLRTGKMKVEFEHLGLQSLRKTLDRVSNRIAYSIVLAALIIGSSLIVLSDIPPRWHDIPLIGIIGFLVAGVMGFWLLLSILRHGRM